MKDSKPSRFEHIVKLLDDAIGGADVQIGAHGPFWRNLRKAEFVAYVLPGFNVKLIETGDPEASNLIKALRGTTPFDDTIYSRMPFRRDPLPEDQIQFIADWIADNCP